MNRILWFKDCRDMIHYLMGKTDITFIYGIRESIDQFDGGLVYCLHFHQKEFDIRNMPFGV